MSEWKETRLGDVISISGGYTYNGKFIGEGENLLLGMGCVSFNELFIEDGARKYAQDAPERFHVLPGDIVIATRQQSDNLPILGAPAIIPKHLTNKRIIVGANLYKVKNISECNNDFIFWLLRWNKYKYHIDSCAKGTTVKMITKDAIESFLFQLPSNNERCVISEILWSITDKIALLQRQNETLEQLAKTIFRQWFVEEAQVFQSLGELGIITSGKSLRRSEFIENGLYPILGANGVIGRTNNYLTDEKIIITGRVGTLGEVKIIDEKSWISDNVLIIKPSQKYYFYPTYFTLKNFDFKNINAGSTQPLVTQSELKKIDIHLGEKERLTAFEKFCQKNFDKIKSNTQQINVLKNMRNNLLHKLMSGEIRVQTPLAT